jgi:hypothetical protein
MAVPAPATPSGNAYTINVARPAGEASALPAFTAAAALLLRRWKVPVRMHVSGDNPPVNALRTLLNEAGAKASAFSPAPSPDIPGEGFWKTTMTVVEARPGVNFWAEEREDRKVEWEPLLVALADRESSADYHVGLHGSLIGIPDLWCVSALGVPTPESPDDTAARWIDVGAKAICVLTPHGIVWKSRGAVFGVSEGTRDLAADPMADKIADKARSLGIFSAGVVSGMIRELLGENLFDKTLIRADRECLEMRPLRLGRSVELGLAALQAAENSGNPVSTLTRNGGLAEESDRLCTQMRGPESKPWAHKGR